MTTQPSAARTSGTSGATAGDVGRLQKIEIENYRGFRGHFELDLPHGCNLLVYGENGAGKSSLFNALSDFLESPDREFFDTRTNRSRPLKHDDHRHRYTAEPVSLRLTFAVAGPAGSVAGLSKVFQWSTVKDDPRLPEMRTVDKGKGCLDYRSLLRVHLLPIGTQEINLFELLINPVLAQHRNPVSAPAMRLRSSGRRSNQPLSLTCGNRPS